MADSVGEIEVVLDRAEFDSAMAELRSFSELLNLVDELRNLLLRLLDGSGEAFVVEHDTTGGALVTARLKPSQALLDLLAALRAVKFKHRVLVDGTHGCSSMPQMKLFVAGEVSGEPKDWCNPMRMFVVAESVDDALRLVDFTNLAVEIDLERPRLLR